MMRFGYRLAQAMQYYTGNPAGSKMGADVNVLPFQISLAAQIPHAVGLAWGLRQQGRDAVVATYFGDGASSEGDAHEAMNLAGVRRAPVVFVLKNNGWAISTPVRKQTATASFAARAAGYGMAGELVDGNDLFADARRLLAGRRAGAGGGGADPDRGPHLPHGPAQHLRRSDALRGPVELEERRAFDPIERVRRYLTAEGLIDEASEQRLVDELRADVDARLRRGAGRARRPAADDLRPRLRAAPGRLDAQRRSAAQEAG